MFIEVHSTADIVAYRKQSLIGDQFDSVHYGEIYSFINSGYIILQTVNTTELAALWFLSNRLLSWPFSIVLLTLIQLYNPNHVTSNVLIMFWPQTADSVFYIGICFRLISLTTPVQRASINQTNLIVSLWIPVQFSSPINIPHVYGVQGVWYMWKMFVKQCRWNNITVVYQRKFNINS